MDRTGKLDDAVLAYRASPTDANRAHLLAVGREHVAMFYAELTGEYIDLTTEKEATVEPP